jgi:hypothetical protein
MGLIVKHSDGSEFLNIENKAYDDVSTSLKLPGKGVLNWGEAYINNFVHLLENFASSTEPVSPQVGQLWYNTGNSVLAVYTVTQEWEVINKDTNIEAKFDALVAKMSGSNAGTVPPVQATAGQTWFDTTINILKVYNGTEWVSFGFNSAASYLQPTNAKASDLWFDKNVDGLKVSDGTQFQRIISTIESISQPQGTSVGQWWTNTASGQMYIYAQEPSTGAYYWKEVGSDDVSEGNALPTDAKTGSLHITRTGTSNVLYVNKGTKSQPVWVEVPEFGGAVKSINEPTRIVDGMFWLDGKDTLKIRKSGAWVDIDEKAISYVSNVMPTSAKAGMVWFDTVNGVMKIKVGTVWQNVQNSGLIEYGNAPTTPKTGQLWYDSVNGELKLWNGSLWSKVNSSATIVGYMTPAGVNDGQLWLDTTAAELKVKMNGRWASLPENARAYLSLPANPRNGDMAYVNNNLKVYDGTAWKDINISIDNSSTGNVSINYDEASHEIVISTDGIVTRVPLAIKRDVIIENVGITSDLVEVIKPSIHLGERRIIDIQKVNLGRQFFVFKNGLFTDNWSVDSKDLVLHSASGEDEIDVMQFNGDISINYMVKKFKSPVNGNFSIDNYTRTVDEQVTYDVVKVVYDAKKAELIAKYTTNSNQASENDLTSADWAILNAIEATFPVKNSNQIADLSLGGIMVFKEGVFIPSSAMTLNSTNDNSIVIPNTNKGEIYTIVQLVAGKDYKSAFFSKEHAFVIGAVSDTTAANNTVKGKVMSDLLKAASADSSTFGKVDVQYAFNETSKSVEFGLIDIDTNYHFFVTRNNLFVSPTNYTVDKINKTLTMHANNADEIRFFQFYLPHNYVPVEFNYKHGLAQSDGWITLELSKDFNMTAPLLVFRNGLLQQKANINVITQETIVGGDGVSYTVNGLRKVQVFGDSTTNNESSTGIKKGDNVTIMQVSQPDIYNIYLEEFGAGTDGFNLFSFSKIVRTKDFMVFRNGIKLEKEDNAYYVNSDGKLVVANCNGPTISELAANANAKGDLISVYQFYTKDAIATDDLTLTEESVTATKTGAEYFQLGHTDFIADEFLLVFKNGQLITRRQSESSGTTQTQINTYKVFAERVYNNTTPALDPNGNQILDSKGNPVINVDPNDYQDITAFSLDNVVPGETIEIYEFNKKVTSVNSLTSETHYEVLPVNNIQRIYTTKFNQLSNLTMIFQDGAIIDRTTDSAGNDTVRTNGMLRLLDQYAVDNNTASIIVNDWKVGGKLRVQQFTAASKDIQTVSLTVRIAVDGTFDVFLPNNEIYTPNAGALEVYVDKVVQWAGEDYLEVANNRIMFTKSLKKDQVVKMIVRR